MQAPVQIVEWEGSAQFRERRLPWNYMPAAVGALTGSGGTAGRHLFALRRGRTGRAGVETAIADAATLADPEAMADLVAQAFPERGAAWPVFLGPPTDTGSDRQARLFPFPVAEMVAETDADRVAVVIDAGIAFWDRAFRTAAGSRFRDILFLDFDAAGGGSAIGLTLGRAGIAQVCALADARGPRAAIEALSAYGASIYGTADGGADNGGSGRLADPDEAWHGTGVADLLAGGAEGERVALFGVELPAAVLRDHDGDCLSAVLALTVEMVLEMTAPLAHLPLVIVLPFGFVSGPQDGTHPVAQSVGDVLMGLRGLREVTLVVPAGNHRQDRCTARLSGPAEVVWRIAPDDFSPNALEIILSKGVGGLWLAPPGQEAIPLALEEGGIALVRRGADVIGAVLRRPDPAGRMLLRLTLGGTGYRRAGAAVAVAGDWRIGLAGEGTADLYILRDDRDRVADGAYPHRGSVFASPSYAETGTEGSPLMDDRLDEVIRRAGTASVLATIPGAVAVGAEERLGQGPARAAWYSGARADGAGWAASELVDDGWPSRGLDCAANGSALRGRMSGTSAAAALHGRRLLGLPPRGAGAG